MWGRDEHAATVAPPAEDGAPDAAPPVDDAPASAVPPPVAPDAATAASGIAAHGLGTPADALGLFSCEAHLDALHSYVAPAAAPLQAFTARGLKALNERSTATGARAAAAVLLCWRLL